jgi:hypothetical protein
MESPIRRASALGRRSMLTAACGVSRRGGKIPARLRIVACAVAGLVVVAGQPAAAQVRHQPVILSFFYPLSTNRTPDVSTNFRLNVFYTRASSVHGVDLGGLVARTDQDFRGLELSLAHSWIGGSMHGIAATAGVQVTGGDTRYVQAAGLVNFVRGDFTGVQLGGLFDFVQRDVTGLQLTSLFNMCDGDGRGLQLSSVMNATDGTFHGIQAGGANYSGRALGGAQLGTINFAAGVHGAQVGAVNFADHVHGTQIGIWNSSRRFDGVPVGVVNLATESGLCNPIAYASSYASFNAGVLTAVRGFYSMLTLGVGDLHENRGDTFFLGWHYGHAWSLTPGWRLGADLGFVHVMPQPSDDPEHNDDLHYAVQPRLLAEHAVGSKTQLFGGAGVNVIASEYSRDATTETELLVLLGARFHRGAR